MGFVEARVQVVQVMFETAPCETRPSQTKRPCAVSTRAQCWDIVGTSWHAEPCGGQVGPCDAMCVWTLYWSMLGPSWGHVGPCGSCVGAIWGQR